MTIAVMGCVRRLPGTFPLEKAENAGNMIHGNAPFEMFADAVHTSDTAAIRATGAKNFAEFVNQSCSHLVLTLANTLRLDKDDNSGLRRMASFLERIEKPVVTFGLGVQSQEDSWDARLPEDCEGLVRAILERTAVLGVRGPLTRRVIENTVGELSNIQVTGCPSLFSRPQSLRALRECSEPGPGLPAFNGTKLHEEPERTLIRRAVEAGPYLVEPVNRFNHRYFVEVSRGNIDAEPPYFLAEFVRQGGPDAAQRLAAHFQGKYRLFRDAPSWYQFVHESVSYSYGSRFHGNMATLLAGKPALWFTHDARTRELVEFHGLPSIDIHRAGELSHEEVMERMDYGPFFARLPELERAFDSYLTANGLPARPAESRIPC